MPSIIVGTAQEVPGPMENLDQGNSYVRKEAQSKTSVLTLKYHIEQGSASKTAAAGAEREKGEEGGKGARVVPWWWECRWRHPTSADPRSPREKQFDTTRSTTSCATSESSDKERIYELPDRIINSVGSERFHCPEVNFTLGRDRALCS